MAIGPPWPSAVTMANAASVLHRQSLEAERRRRWILPGGAGTVAISASICLVDRVEVNGGALKFSSPIGLSGGTFTAGGSGRLCYNGLC
jgi:hypothetical protein